MTEFQNLLQQFRRYSAGVRHFIFLLLHCIVNQMTYCLSPPVSACCRLLQKSSGALFECNFPKRAPQLFWRYQFVLQLFQVMNLIALSAVKILSYPYLLRSASLSVLHFRQTDARIFVQLYLADSVLRDPLKKGTTLLLAVKSLQNLSSNPGGREKCGSDIYGNLTQISPPKKPGNADILGISAEDIYSGQTTWTFWPL